MRITRLNPVDLAWILGLFEAATLFILALAQPIAQRWSTLGQDIALGVIVGLLGTFIALILWHALRPILRARLDGRESVITGIGIGKACLANAAFLAVLFIIEDAILALKGLPVVGVAVFGLVATFLSLAVLFMLYNSQPVKLGTNLGLVSGVAPIRAAVLAGIYEAVILPVMTFIMALPGPTLLTYTMAGALAGIIGGFIGTFIFNILAPRMNLWIEFA